MPAEPSAAPDRAAAAFSIKEISGAEGGLCRELWAEGHCVATARVRGHALADMRDMLGLTGQEVGALLDTALVERFERERAMVSIATPRLQAPPAGSVEAAGRYVSLYTQNDGAETTAGAVWFDRSSNTTGPEGVPAIVRAKMRVIVQRQLAPRGTLQLVIDVLDAMSS